MEYLNRASETEKEVVTEYSDDFQKIDKYDAIKNAAVSLKNKLLDLQSSQIYQVNIYDILKVSENRHSAILGKILKFKVDGNYIFIPSFVKKLLGIDITFIHSELAITVERYRIDLLIRDKTSAIIIENKIHGAKDQKEQLRRYIDVAKYLGIKEGNVYVIYLAGVNRDYNLSNSICGYKNSFEERFKISSFKEDVLTWLDKDVYPNIKIENESFNVFVKQYIEHLYNRYYLKSKNTRNESMNKKINEYLFETLKLDNENKSFNINVLNEEIKLVSDLKSRLDTLLLEQKEAMFNLWEEQLKRDFPNLDVQRNIEKQLTKVGVLIKLDEGSFSILIEKNENSIYFGAGRHFTQDKELNKQISNICDDFLTKDFKVTKWWYGYRLTDYALGYRELYELIHRFINSEYCVD